MKTILIISLIYLSLCDEITITAQTFAPNSNSSRVDITVKASANPGTTVATGLFKIKSTSGTPVALTECGEFTGSYSNADSVLSATCDLGTVANGVYNLVANSVTSGSNTLKLVVTELTTALTVASNAGTTADIGGTANALTVSKITKTDSGASITFQASAAIADAHSSIEGLFVVKKDSTDVPLTCNLPVAAINTNSTATCTIPSNTAAGDYVLQANAGGVASGTIKFTVALINGITDADKTITISAAAGGAGGAGGTGGTGGTDNKADFISFSKYLFTIFILFL
jgi:hypothetical protein